MDFTMFSKNLCQVRYDLCKWELHILLSAAIRAPAERPSPEDISAETSHLLEKETGVPSKVHVHVHVW